MINTVDFPSVVPGTASIFAVCREAPCPIGFIHYRIIMNSQVEILDCYVMEIFRHRGILTQMFMQVREWYPEHEFITEQGSKSSTPWLRKMGFVFGKTWSLAPFKTK